MNWADGMKAGSIMAVVLYHTEIQADIKSLAYFLCLPAFFFVSGMFANASMDVKCYWQRRSLRLLVPYVCFGVLSWLAWLIIGRRYGSDAGAGTAWWEPLWGMVVGRSESLIQNGPLWFLPCLFVVEWLYYFVKKFCSKWLWPCTLILAVAGYCLGEVAECHLPWSADTAMTMLPLYVAGQQSRDQFASASTKLRWWQTAMAWIVAAIGTGVVWYFNRDIKLSEGHYGNGVLFYTGEVLVVIFWWLTALLAGQKAGNWWGQHTMLILCMHLPLFGAIKGALMLCGVPLEFYATNTGSLLLWAGSLLVCIPLILIIDRYLPFLGGRLQKREA